MHIREKVSSTAHVVLVFYLHSDLCMGALMILHLQSEVVLYILLN